MNIRDRDVKRRLLSNSMGEKGTKETKTIRNELSREDFSLGLRNGAAHLCQEKCLISWLKDWLGSPIQIQLQALASIMVIDIAILPCAVEWLWSTHSAYLQQHCQADANKGRGPSGARVVEWAMALPAVLSPWWDCEAGGIGFGALPKHSACDSDPLLPSICTLLHTS